MGSEPGRRLPETKTSPGERRGGAATAQRRAPPGRTPSPPRAHLGLPGPGSVESRERALGAAVGRERRAVPGSRRREPGESVRALPLPTPTPAVPAQTGQVRGEGVPSGRAPLVLPPGGTQV